MKNIIIWLSLFLLLTLTQAGAVYKSSSNTGGGGGGGTPGGSNGQIQYNNNGAFGGVTLVALNHGGTNADLSATGGASYVLQQSSVGAAVTVGQLGISDISGMYGSVPNSDIFVTNLLPFALTGTGETAVGYGALSALTSGSNNTAVGESAGVNVSTGVQNSIFGLNAAPSLNAGSYNTIIGSAAGNGLTSGTFNTLIGIQALAGSSSAVNQIALGYDAVAPANNTAIIGNSSVTDIYFGDNTAKLHADGSLLTAVNAVKSGITDDTTTNATMFPTWVTANTGNLPVKTTSTKLSFNPSTGVLSSTSFTGAGTGLTGTVR